MCTKIHEKYSCAHTTVLPPSQNIHCCTKFKTGTCPLSDKEKEVKIVERGYLCRGCWLKKKEEEQEKREQEKKEREQEKEWVEVGEGGVDGREEDVDVVEAAMARKRHAAKGSGAKGCGVM